MSGVAASFMAAGTANATNGYFSNGYGTAAKGMAGAGVASPEDTQAGTNNPAGMRALGNRVDASVAVFSPRRAYSTAGAGPAAFINDNDQKSSQNIFLVPSFGLNYDMGEYSLGVTMSANGGMNTNYQTNVFTGGTSDATGINLEQALLGFTYSRNLGASNTFGITPTIAAQRFKATGLQGFKAISTDPNKLTDNGLDYSYGYGLRLGWIGEVNDQLSFGAMAQSRMYMQKLKKYAGLFAGGGEFDIPATVSLGATFKPTEKLKVSADAERIFYGDVESISNSHNTPTSGFNRNIPGTTTGSSSLGGSNGIGFGWDDMNVFKLGGEYAYSKAMTLRAGVSHNSAAFSNTETLFNILAPATVNTHLSFGGTYEFAPNMSLSMAYTHAFAANITGTNVNHGSPIDLKMYQDDLEVGFKYEF
ncbi:hypothetical protein BEN30_03920 [Magnetovibrio blakemorei]|uniref:Long-chain fatty acid transporter n=2 Tax=Magnetovibrio blakemorei TaxID=28181 RepID=A0A1E5QB51_9PROT|nr:hypothetical protein BEN30_03920 [Magnetovibrio blakemorei]